MEHQLFSKTIEVVTNEEGTTVLENGENEYPFMITLPKDLPSSYHTVFGWGLDYGKEHGKDFVIGYKIYFVRTIGINILILRTLLIDSFSKYFSNYQV